MRTLIEELKMCYGKRTYNTLKEAKKQSRKHSEMFNKVMRPYECKVCCYFHLTSKPNGGDK